MSQHFLLSAAARTLSLRDVFDMSEADAFETMRLARWGEDGPLCPRCGFEASWFIGSRRQWRCKDCGHTYSVTSGTPFADHKLPLKVYLAAILLFANAVKGLSSLQLARDLGVQQKTAYVLLQKLREGLLESRDPSALKGEVEVDGGYTGHYVRPSNRKEDRQDRRSTETPNKRCILVLRQRGERGAVRTVTEVIRSENGREVTASATSRPFSLDRKYSGTWNRCSCAVSPHGTQSH